jgi:hypothetical protein
MGSNGDIDGKQFKATSSPMIPEAKSKVEDYPEV